MRRAVRPSLGGGPGSKSPPATQRRGMFIADGRLASAALALADADVAGAHDVRAVPELLRDAAVLHWAVRVLLLPVERHLLHERDLLGVNFRRAHLAPLLVLRLLLIVVLRVDDADDVDLVGEAHRWRQHQRVAVNHPTHFLHHIHHRRRLRQGRRNLRVCELHGAELVFARVPYHIARQLLDELQDVLRAVHGQGSQRLLQRCERVRDSVPRRVARVAHGGGAGTEDARGATR
mmetsp:Transcript_100461/g.288654  ORF Transcript_100461/g.288654 Transcript_100461/m.288654 type:complete len:234 (+) Transcript_100461:282-983(+)